MSKLKDWELYEKGIAYNNSLFGNDKNYYEDINNNLSFFAGDQWKGVKTNGLPKPVFNIIKRILTFKVASLTSNKVSINLEPMEYRPNDGDITMQNTIKASELANAEINNILEKNKFEFRIRDALTDAGVTGDMAAHWIFDTDVEPFKNHPNSTLREIIGAVRVELVDGANVMYGNPNVKDTQKQPYILLVGRDLVTNLIKEAEQYKKIKKEQVNIQADKEYDYQSGENSKVEIEGDKSNKALFIIKYFKKDGKVYASKLTRDAYIYEELDTGLELYPIAFGNWEKIKGTYHGRSEITGLIPNQIAINKMMAMVIYHLMMTAFPKVVYNADKIKSWTNRVGEAIKVNNLQPNESVRNVASYLDTPTLSAQITNVIEQVVQYTKEMMGASDASLGNVSAVNTSAIIAVQKSTVVPLENIKANLYEFVEDNGKIIVDIMSNKYGNRPVVIEKEKIREMHMFDFSSLKGMWMNTNANVGDATYWSEISTLTTLDNLLSAGRMEFIDYLERLPEGIIPQKEELISSLESQTIDQQALESMMNRFVEGLQQANPETFAYLQSIKDPDLQKREILTMMGAYVPDQPQKQSFGASQIELTNPTLVSDEILGASPRATRYLEGQENKE